MMAGKKASHNAGGGNFFPALCNILGTLILLSVVLIFLPVTIPRIAGYEIYDVVSGSMEPEIPTGSVIYVRPVDTRDVQEGDIIAFQSGDSVITHRVIQNQVVEGRFTTKGDANTDVDMNTVPYTALIGKVVLHLPVLGDLMTVLTGTIGKAYMLCYACCGVMFHMLAGRMRRRRYTEIERKIHDSHGAL